MKDYFKATGWKKIRKTRGRRVHSPWKKLFVFKARSYGLPSCPIAKCVGLRKWFCTEHAKYSHQQFGFHQPHIGVVLPEPDGGWCGPHSGQGSRGPTSGRIVLAATKLTLKIKVATNSKKLRTLKFIVFSSLFFCFMLFAVSKNCKNACKMCLKKRLNDAVLGRGLI